MRPDEIVCLYIGKRRNTSNFIVLCGNHRRTGTGTTFSGGGGGASCPIVHFLPQNSLRCVCVCGGGGGFRHSILNRAIK